VAASGAVVSAPSARLDEEAAISEHATAQRAIVRNAALRIGKQPGRIDVWSRPERGQ